MFLVVPSEPINVIEFTDVAILGGVGLIVAAFSVCFHMMRNPNPKWDYLQALLTGFHTEHMCTPGSVFRWSACTTSSYGT